MKINLDFIKKIFNREVELVKKSDKIKLSKYEEYIPMYDIYSDDIYYINNLNLHYRLKDCHFRFITSDVKQWIENKYKKSIDKDNLNKYKKNLEIIKNYDIETLEKTSYETLYKYSPDLGLSLSICKRNSFNKYSKHLTPYYTRNELIKLGMNNKIIKKLSAENLIDKKLHYEICLKVSKNDISTKQIQNSMNHIIKSKSINWINFYSLMGSYIFNDYLRDNSIISKYMLDGLYKIYDCISSAPSFENSFYFYRFLWDDDFISKLKIGQIFIDKGFLSTTRDPFYSPGLEGEFGLILVKINIPKILKVLVFL